MDPIELSPSSCSLVVLQPPLGTPPLLPYGMLLRWRCATASGPFSHRGRLTRPLAGAGRGCGQDAADHGGHPTRTDWRPRGPGSAGEGVGHSRARAQAAVAVTAG